ncbi:MAG TPA: multiheme c-type cytochrome [Flavobacteriales bacterium]|nr:multiheme c-type cytochrome [Flavobacteriales bacterium]
MRGNRSFPVKFKILAVLGAAVLVSVAWSTAVMPVRGPHSALELRVLRDQIEGLDVQFGSYFVTSGRCAGCHGHDSLGYAMVAGEGEDVNVANDWRSTMMANSARDPFFLAKMEHEGLVNPALQAQIENTCLKCHAPLAVFEQQMKGGPAFTAASLDTSVFARDGVSCLACHMQDPDSAGNFFSGDLHFDSARVWGPYNQEQIHEEIMQFFVGFTPDQGSHILDGRVCAGCHTAINHPVDLEGNPTGTSFYEQTLWQEYVNSIYYGTEQNCRSCHMPRIQDSVVLASGYAFLTGQSPFGKHHLTGGSEFMLKMMRDHIGDFGIPATPTQFDSTIARSRQLRQTTMSMSLDLIGYTDDTLFVDVTLNNLIGHKFPGGFPNRRAFVRLVALSATGDTLFQSGGWDGSYEVIGNDLPYEPHHDVITQGDQAQIYEFVMGDVNHDVTTTLLRAVHRLKDNRLVPIGYSVSHPSQDTTAIAGLALTDPDFNHDADGVEGNGGDIVHYHIPMDGYGGAVQVKASVWFQQVPPRWNEEMLEYHGARIDPFRAMYEAADNTPELVVGDSLSVTPTGIAVRATDPPIRVFPNPTYDGRVLIDDRAITAIVAYSATGQRVAIATDRTAQGWRCELPPQAGSYLLRITTAEDDRIVRVVRADH